MNKKKLLALLMALVMTLTLVPVTAFAEGDNVAQIGTTEYATLEEALAAAGSGATVNLIADIDYSTTYTTRNARDNQNGHAVDLKDVTLDMGNHTIKSINGTVTFGGNGATIKNGTFDIVEKDTNGSYKDGSYALIIDNYVNAYGVNGTVNLENLTIDGGLNVKKATVNVTNCTAHTTTTNFHAIWTEDDAVVTIYSGSYINTNDGTINGTDHGDVISTGTSTEQGFLHEAGSKLYIRGGYFYDATNNNNKLVGGFEQGSIIISGGFFSTQPAADLIKTGYKVVTNTGSDSQTYPYMIAPSAVAEIVETGVMYDTLAEAIAAVPENTQTTIQMIADEVIEGNAGVTIPANKNIILNLNGHTVSNHVTQDANSQVIKNEGTLTIQDSGATAGELKNVLADGVSGGSWSGKNYSTAVINNSGVLTISSGKLTQTADGNICQTIDNSGTVTIQGGEVTSEKGIGLRLWCNSTTKTASLTMTDGSISAIWDVFIQNPGSGSNLGTFSMSGGTMTATKDCFFVSSDSNDWTSGFSFEITDGTFNAGRYIFNLDDNQQLSGFAVSGGKYAPNGESSAVAYAANSKNKLKMISGGVFSQEPDAAYIVEGKVAIANTDSSTSEDYPHTVGTATTYVAQIGNVKYETLADAVAAVPANGTETTITLLQDVELDSTVTVDENRNVKLNLGEHEVSLPENANYSALYVKHGKLTLGGKGTISGSPSNYKLIYLTGATEDVENYSNLVISRNVTINCPNGYGVMVSATDVNKAYGVNITVDGTINAAYGGPYVNGSITSSGTYVPNITVNTSGKVNADNTAIYAAGVAKYILKGTITGGECAVEVRAGEMTISGAKLISTADHFSCNPNNNGTTTVGAALAIAQHTTKQNIKVTATSTTFSGVYAINECNPQENDPAPQVDISVTGGTIKGQVAAADAKKFISGGSSGTPCTVVVDQEYIADEYSVFDYYGETPYVIHNGNVVATITRGDETYRYPRPLYAVNAAQSGETVTMVEDYTQAYNAGALINVAKDKTVTVDLNGHSITNNGTQIGALVISLPNANSTLVLTGSGTIDGKKTVKLSGKDSKIVFDGDITVQGSIACFDTNVTDKINPTIEIKNGAFKAGNEGLFSSLSKPQNCDIIITGGKFSSEPNSSYVADGYKAASITDETYHYQVGIASIESAANGTIEGDSPATSVTYTVNATVKDTTNSNTTLETIENLSVSVQGFTAPAASDSGSAAKATAALTNVKDDNTLNAIVASAIEAAGTSINNVNTAEITIQLAKSGATVESGKVTYEVHPEAVIKVNNEEVGTVELTNSQISGEFSFQLYAGNIASNGDSVKVTHIHGGETSGVIGYFQVVDGYITVTGVTSFSDFVLEPVTVDDVTFQFLGGSLRKRLSTATNEVVYSSTDIRFGYSITLPEGATLNNEDSYFYWVKGTDATATGGKTVTIQNYTTNGNVTTANLVITKVPSSAYSTSMTSRVHIQYTLNGEVYEVDYTPAGSTRTINGVCQATIDSNDSADEPWKDYAQNLMYASSN